MMELLMNYEFGVLNLIQANLTNPILDKIMIMFTYLGTMGFIWILMALMLLMSTKYRKNGVAMAASLLVCLLIGNVILKPLIGRIRPCDVNTAVQLLISRPLDASFPSGHAMSSFAAATTIFYFNKKMGAGAFLLAATISFSRMYLYVHYPTDIGAGALIGILIAVVCKKIVDKYYRKKNDMVIDRYVRH
ncbi:MAG: phosphatase PAP2 family protein [Proteocatella sp.]